MDKDEALRMALEALENNRQTHNYCEDTWYSCPKHEDGCANDSEGDECNCGADNVNAQFDKAITAIKEALAQPEQEPVAYWNFNSGFSHCMIDQLNEAAKKNPAPIYTTPPQREWVGLTGPEVDEAYKSVSNKEWAIGGLDDARVFFCAIEAKLREKNTC